MLARRVEKRTLSLVLGISLVSIGITMLLLTFLYPTPRVRPEYDNYMVTSFMVGILPVAVLQFLDSRWRAMAESKLPNLIRDIIEANKSGMPYLKAVEYTATLRYGVLSDEVKRMVARMKLGDPFEDAIMGMARRIGTPLAYRTAILLIEVGRHGGKIQEMLEEVYSHIRELQDLLADRKRQITPYIFVFYAAFGIYLFTVAVLFMTFFSQAQALTPMAGIPGAFPMAMAEINPERYHIWFYHMGAVEAIVGGFVIGKIGEGKSVAGVKHMLVMLFINFITFTFLIS